MVEYIINRKNLAFCLLLVGSVWAIYSKIGSAVLLLAVVFMFMTFIEKSSNVIETFIGFLIIYLPFYTFFRNVLVYLGGSFLAPVYNNIRDCIILGMLCFCFFKQRIAFTRDDFAWLFFFLNWLYGFFLSTLYGYPILGISGFHLTVVPSLLYLIVVYSGYSFNFERIENLFLKISVSVALVGLIAYYARPLYFQNLFVVAGNLNDPSDYVRFTSLFFTPNVCGCYLAVALCVLLSKTISEKRLSYLSLIPLFVFCILLTLSRGAWMFMVMAIFVSLFFLKAKLPFVVLLLSSLAWFCSMFFDDLVGDLNVPMYEIIGKRIDTLLSINDESSYGRVSYWQTAVNMLLDHPAGFGMGVATTAQISRDVDADVLVIDGFYIKTIIETSFMGVAFCVVFIIWAMNKVKMIFNPFSKNHAMLALLIVLGYFVQSFGSNVFDFVSAAPWFWLFLGLSVKENNNQPAYGNVL